MTVLVTVLVFMANLALSAPLPLPQDVIATATLTEPELASLIPVLDFLSTFVFSSPTQDISILSPAASPTSSTVTFSQTTSQAIVSSLTSSSVVQQETEPVTSTEDTDQSLNNNENVQTEVTHGPVTFGELTTPSEGGTFNKFVENDGTNSSTTGEIATSMPSWHSAAHASTFAANTLTSYALFTQSTTVHLSPTETWSSKTFSTQLPAPSPTSKASAVYHKRSFKSHEIKLAKRLFPSLFKDNEGFDRFDVPGFSHGKNNNNNNNGKDAGQILPPNVVPPGVSLFGPPPPGGSGKGSSSDNEGNNSANNEDGNGSATQDNASNGGSHGGNNVSNSTSTNDRTSESNPFPPFPSETSVGPPPGLFLPPPPRGLTHEPPEP